MVAGDPGKVEDSKGVAGPRCREASQTVNMSTTANAAKTEFRRRLDHLRCLARCPKEVASEADCLSTGRSLTAARFQIRGRLDQVRLNQVRLNQVRLNQVRCDQLKCWARCGSMLASKIACLNTGKSAMSARTALERA